MDEVDITVDREAEMMEKFQREIRQAVQTPELPRTGFCHWCEEPVNPVQIKGETVIPLFCDSECSQDYERSKRP